MRKKINVKFESKDENDICTGTYWETISLEIEDNANMTDVCESICHHDIQVLSMQDIEADVIDVEWQ